MANGVVWQASLARPPMASFPVAIWLKISTFAYCSGVASSPFTQVRPENSLMPLHYCWDALGKKMPIPITP